MGELVYLGMSGGVDSALAAALLLERGFEVRGVYMRNWTRDLPGFRCPWAEELADAERVATTLGIELDVWDCEAEYRSTVADYLVDAYARGYTPNPDVMCNQTVKFGTFAERAFSEGADLIATGHYAQVAGGGGEGARLGADGGAAGDVAAEAKAGDRPARLLRARDEHKDQTYFLWRVDGRVLARTLFPIGDIRDKAEVRRMCAERGLGIENKPDSDGICFVGPVGMRTFLLDSLERRAGEVREWETDAVLGHHDGAFLFTVGQRRGLDLGGGPARYVVATDVERNVVYVTADRACPALRTCELALEDCHWISGSPVEAGDFLVRTRHTGALSPARAEPSADGRACRLIFAEEHERVAPGQSAVIYRGRECTGGGLVAKVPLGELRS